MRIIKTQVPASIITADGGQWICTCVDIDGEMIEVRAPIRSSAWLLEQVVERLTLPVMRQEEQMRREDSAVSYEVAIAEMRRRLTNPT